MDHSAVEKEIASADGRPPFLTCKPVNRTNHEETKTRFPKVTVIIDYFLKLVPHFRPFTIGLVFLFIFLSSTVFLL